MSQIPPPTFSLKRLALAVVAILPAVVMAILIHAYAVNVPWSDEWDEIPILQQAHAGTLTLAHLLSQHMEHRILIPRLISLLVASVAHADVRYEMAFTFLVACAISIGLLQLIRQTLPPSYRLAAWIVANLLIFSPVQYENWLMGIQTQAIFPIACLIWAILIARSRINAPVKFIACALLCAIASLSLTNGLICWLLLPILLFMSHDIKRPSLLLCAWVCCFAAMLWIYFHGYVKPPIHSPEPTTPASIPGYLLTFLGASLCRGPGPEFAAIFGIIFLSLWIAECIYLYQHRRDPQSLSRSLPWFLLAAFVLASASMAAVGRHHLGMRQAQESRYTTTSLYFILSVLILAIMIWHDTRHRPQQQHRHSSLPLRLALFAVLLLLISDSITFIHAVGDMQKIRLKRLRGQAAIQWLNLDNSDDCLKYLYPNPQQIHDRVRFMNAMGYLQHPIAATNQLDTLPNSPPAGLIESTHLNPDGSLTLTGWATLPIQNRSPDCLLLAYRNPTGHLLAFRLSDLSTQKDNIRNQTPWQTTIPPTELPSLPARITVWAFDVVHQRIYKLQGQADVTRTLSDRLYWRSQH